jgi:sterol desaturase/sphingolipid hydroxylase (fatty acid hydroxylase superfamily)
MEEIAVLQWIANQFAALHQWAFESAVLPAVHALGLGAYAEQAFDWTEIFLIGAIEISLLAIVLTALEKWRPVEIQPGPGKYVDVIYTMLQRLGVIPLAIFLLLMPIVDGIDGWLRMHDFIPPKVEDALPFLHNQPLLSFLFYLVVLDFVAYWLHRWQHRVNAWWALHALHHSQRQMSFWSDDRNHLLDDLLVDGAFALVALLIGMAPAQFVTLVVASRVVESLSHANVRLSFGRIGERLLVSPRFHRVHHAIGLGHEGSHRGCNFSVLFPIWDVLFGTANFAREFPATGVRDQLDGRDYGSGFVRQQLLGIRRVGEALGLLRRV